MPNRRRRRRAKVGRKPKRGAPQSSTIKTEAAAPAKESRLLLNHLWQRLFRRSFLPVKRRVASSELGAVIEAQPAPPASPLDESERLLYQLFSEYYTELLSGEEANALGTYNRLEDATRMSPLSPSHIDEIRSRARREVIQGS